MDLFWGVAGTFAATAFGAWRTRPAWLAIVPGLALGWYGVRAEPPGADGIRTSSEVLAIAAMLASALLGAGYGLLVRGEEEAGPVPARPAWRRWRLLAIATWSAGLLVSFALFIALTAVDADPDPGERSFAFDAMPWFLVGAVLLGWRWQPLVVPLAAAALLVAAAEAVGEPGGAPGAVEAMALGAGAIAMLVSTVLWAGRERARWWGIALSFLVPVVGWAAVVLLVEPRS